MKKNWYYRVLISIGCLVLYSYLNDGKSEKEYLFLGMIGVMVLTFSCMELLFYGYDTIKKLFKDER